MNELHLGRCLGAVSPQAFRRVQKERLLQSLKPSSLSFGFQVQPESINVVSTASRGHLSDSQLAQVHPVAHGAGVNVLAIDQNDGRYLLSGGADSTVRLWDLENVNETTSSQILGPAASLTKSRAGSHTHALTSISIYPFDPTPTMFLSTAYDKTLRLTSITPTSLEPGHTFPFEYVPFTHALSPIPSHSVLVAVGTAHPAVRLLDLRSGLATHSLPGHNGAVYSLSWSPRLDHILASGAADGRVLFFDIRRAQSAFATLDLDDAIGVVAPDHTPEYKGRRPLDWNMRAHGGPVTGLRWMPAGDKVVTTGHDQRIRVWDTATGRNDLVHFGPRIRNARNTEFAPLISPAGFGRTGKETLLWANDDNRGEIFMFSLREGSMLRTLKTPGVARGPAQARAADAAPGRFNSVGRINAMAWRCNAAAGGGVEMYSAHGDGSIHCWTGLLADGDEEIETKVDVAFQESERKRKRNRDLVSDLVEGLIKRPATSM